MIFKPPYLAFSFNKYCRFTIAVLMERYNDCCNSANNVNLNIIIILVFLNSIDQRWIKILPLKRNEMYYIHLHNTSNYTLLMRCGHRKHKALQKSFRATWHSNSNAPAQSISSNVKAKCGCWGVAGHKRARTMVVTNGSHSQYIKVKFCSLPALYLLMSTLCNIN